MTRDEMLAAIDAIYRARMTRNCDGLDRFVDPDATFEFAGENEAAGGLPAKGSLMDAVCELNDGIAMHAMERIDAVVEGNKVANLVRVHVQFGKGKPFDTLLFTLWTFGPDGRICDCREFVDTARARAAVKEAMAAEGMETEIVETPAP